MKKIDLKKHLTLWAAIAIGALIMVVTSIVASEIFDNIRLSGVPMTSAEHFVQDAHSGMFKMALVDDHGVYGILKSNMMVGTRVNDREQMLTVLEASNVQVRPVPRVDSADFYTIAALAILEMLLVNSLRRNKAQGRLPTAGPGALSRSKAVMNKPGTVKTTFKDVAGLDEIRVELEEIVDFLRSPQKYHKVGAKLPKGALLVGSPGNGKTLLARAIAGEANVPFFSISGSDFVEMFVGVGAARVRDLFAQAKKHAPCIIFIDEVDAVGRARGVGNGGGNDEREQTLNQLLVEMDGFGPTAGIVVLAATNRPEILDQALLRPGRFDRQVHVPLPNQAARELILKTASAKVPLASSVDLTLISKSTPGFSGADLGKLINEAAIAIARDNRSAVEMSDLERAKDKIIMGSPRTSLAMTEEERKMTAYHEAGHAICAVLTEECDPVHKATIVPHGHALGMVVSIPDTDTYGRSIAKLKAEVMMAMGGRAAEAIIFGEDKVSNGASGDIQMATARIRKMVSEWGFSDKIGMVSYASAPGAFGPSNYGHCSQDTAREIDLEIRQLTKEAYNRALALLCGNEKALHALANRLLDVETMQGDEIRALIAENSRRQLPKQVA